MNSRPIGPRTRRPAPPPLIGVTTSEVRKAETVQPTPEGEPPRHEMALGLTSMRAVDRAGAIPLVIPPLGTDTIGPLLARLDGICLSGGPDIHPQSYGEEPHEQLGPTEPDLDRFELTIARWADTRGLPILAICRGMQAINVARGGSLNQHLPDEPSDVDHRQSLPGQMASHRVEIKPGSRLANTLGTTVTEVNSFHHQAISGLGQDLEAVAWSDDGTIEAIEDPDRRFLIGVQWHAELLVDRRAHLTLFERFTDSAGEFGRERLGQVAA